jgi:5-deoxy-glucuronate isomerase
VKLATQHHLPEGPGLHAVDGGDLVHLEFVLARVGDGELRELDLGDREAVIVKLEGGPGRVEVDAASFALPGRRSVFSDPPSAVYAPPGTNARLHGPLLAGIFLARADADEAPDAYAVLPDEITSVSRGADNFSREVHDIVSAERPACRLLVGETLNPPGNWSSAPPHKHDVDGPPHEAKLEEIYLYRVDPAQGFGVQGSYSAEPPERRAFIVEDLDVVTIPSGYHPVAAGPGYDLYYLWGLAGTGRELLWNPDPAHAWVEERARS